AAEFSGITGGSASGGLFDLRLKGTPPRLGEMECQGVSHGATSGAHLQPRHRFCFILSPPGVKIAVNSRTANDPSRNTLLTREFHRTTSRVAGPGPAASRRLFRPWERPPPQ